MSEVQTIATAASAIDGRSAAEIEEHNKNVEMEEKMNEAMRKGDMMSIFKNADFRKQFATKSANMEKHDYKHLEDDVTHESLTTALDLLEKEVSEAHQKMVNEGDASADMWRFEACNLGFFNQDLTGLYTAYLNWSFKGDEKNPEPHYNVHAAFRRLEQLAKWGYARRSYLNNADNPYTMAEMQLMHRIYGGCVLKDGKGGIIWALKADNIVVDEMSKRSVEAHVRYCWWLIHAMAFDEECQTYGGVFVQNLKGANLRKLIGVMPPGVKAEMDNLTQGCSAIRFKKFYILEAGWMMRGFIKLVSVFMSKKMRSRFEVIGSDWSKFYEAIGGKQYYPEAFGGTGPNIDRYIPDYEVGLWD